MVNFDPAEVLDYSERCWMTVRGVGLQLFFVTSFGISLSLFVVPQISITILHELNLLVPKYTFYLI